MRLLLLRTGQSTAETEDRYPNDEPLTPFGREQARDVAKHLRSEEIERIVASPLQRACETAQIIADELGLPLQSNRNLRERERFGTLAGMKRTVAYRKHPQLVRSLLHPDAYAPGGEEFEAFEQRVLAAFDEIEALGHQTVLVVTHAGPMRCMIRLRLGLDEIDVAHCGMIDITSQTGIERVQDHRE